MSDSKISALPSAGALSGSELIPIVQGGATKQSTLTAVASLVDLSSYETINNFQKATEISATASGTNTYTATITPAIASYAAKQRFYITFTNANTGASTLNLNGLGNIAIRKNGPSAALASGDISAGQVLLLVYDGGEFQIIGGIGSGGSSTYSSLTDVNLSSIADAQLSQYRTSDSKWHNFTLSGDITINNSGVSAIGAGKVTNSMLAGSIAYSKLSLAGAILNSDLAGSIAYSKLSLTGSIVNADISSSAAIAYSKLNLSGSIINGDLASNSLTANKFGTQSANTVLAGPTSGAAATPTFRSLSKNDIAGVYSEIGNIVTENWTNLSNWTGVGTPVASVSGNKLNLGGTASSSTNYIYQSAYGITNYELMTISWTEIVGTIGASSNGIAFGLQSACSLGASYQNSMMVNIELSNTNTGVIKWFINNSGTATQTSAQVLVPVAGNTLNCTLYIYPDKYVFKYNINGGKDFYNTLYHGTFGGSSPNGYNAGRFAFFNLGGGSSHSVGAFTANSNQFSNSDVLLVGNSIFAGYGASWYYQRISTYVGKRTNNLVENYARPSNGIADYNITELTALNPLKLVVMGCSNDITANGAVTAGTALASFVTAVAGIVNANAPSGYSIGNGNLVICTELPRTGISAIATFNTNIISTYGASNLLHLNGVISDNTTTFPLALSWDGIHPNEFANSKLADSVISYFGYKKNINYTNDDFFFRADSLEKNTINTSLGNEMYMNYNSGFKFLTWGIYNNGSYVARTAATQQIYQDPTNGLVITTNNGLTIGNTFTATARLLVNYSGNIVTGSTLSDKYRNTNGGSDVLGHLIIDPASSITSGNAFTFDSTNGFGFTRANGTRRIQRWAASLTNNTDTAASEQSDLILSSTIAGAALSERLRFTANGDIKLQNAGQGIYMKEGTNATMGIATLSAGTVVVSTTKVTANSRIQLSIQSLGTVSAPKAIGVTARTGGTSFTITSADNTDTSVIAWWIAEPA